MIKYLKEENLDEIITSGLYILDFYADWCGPCNALAPILEQIDFADVIKINVDEHPEYATKYGVMSIPTLIFTEDGNEIHKEIGYRSLTEIKNTFDTISSKK